MSYLLNHIKEIIYTRLIVYGGNGKQKTACSGGFDGPRVSSRASGHCSKPFFSCMLKPLNVGNPMHQSGHCMHGVFHFPFDIASSYVKLNRGSHVNLQSQLQIMQPQVYT